MEDLDGININDRMFIASKIYNSLDTCFIGGKSLLDYNLDTVYEGFLEKAIKEENRFKFGMLMMEFLASFKNGLTKYSDPYINKKNGKDLGFKLVNYDGKWIVKDSRIQELINYDIISEIDGQNIDDFFAENSKCISACSEREAKTRLSSCEYLFPEKFSLKLEGGRVIFIDRSSLNISQNKIEPDGMWIKEGEIAYLKIPSFSSPKFEEKAIEYVKTFKNSKTMIIDLRETGGHITPYDLINVLMDRPYRLWSEATPANIGMLRSHGQIVKARFKESNSFQNSYFKMCRAYNQTTLMWGSPYEQSDNNIFKGKINILVDGSCCYAAEDFVLPFKDNKRATIMGEKTMGCSGMPFMYTFKNGISISVETKKPFFPDGSSFEGVGISPDIGIHPTIDQLKGNKDSVLTEAIRLTNMFSR